jgi:hypothetical protein
LAVVLLVSLNAGLETKTKLKVNSKLYMKWLKQVVIETKK